MQFGFKWAQPIEENMEQLVSFVGWQSGRSHVSILDVVLASLPICIDRVK